MESIIIRMDLILLAAGWLAYALLHSLLASLHVKAWFAHRWPGVAHCYRLLFNLIATLTLLPLLWASFALSGTWWWRWTGVWSWLANGLTGAALLVLFLSSRDYDMTEFLGLRAWRERRQRPDDGDHFCLSVWHRYVRHPWYALALVLIWTRDMNAPLFISSSAASLYFILGARLEERKLEARFGALYAEYRRRVPAFFPLPWRFLSPEEAQALLERYRCPSAV